MGRNRFPGLNHPFESATLALAAVCALVGRVHPGYTWNYAGIALLAAWAGQIYLRRRSKCDLPSDPVERMFELGQTTVLLRPDNFKNLTEEQRIDAFADLEREMARVASGKVWLTARTKQEIEAGASVGKSAHTADVLIDRFAVTNDQYQAFVDDNGYGRSEFWEGSVSMRNQFTDSTGKPGPRYWKNGTYHRGKGQMPVVGVSWYEARAFAKWAGKRLPSCPEWVKAAVAPSSSPQIASQQRKYPWGESVEPSQANLWQAGVPRTVAVSDYVDSSLHGIHQMVGNVWEWNRDDFAAWDTEEGWTEGGSNLKSIRGGAFDTYLEAQAACPSQSGEEPSSRRHNIGFRCVADPGEMVLQD